MNKIEKIANELVAYIAETSDVVSDHRDDWATAMNAIEAALEVLIQREIITVNAFPSRKQRNEARKKITVN